MKNIKRSSTHSVGRDTQHSTTTARHVTQHEHETASDTRRHRRGIHQDFGTITVATILRLPLRKKNAQRQSQAGPKSGHASKPQRKTNNLTRKKPSRRYCSCPLKQHTCREKPKQAQRPDMQASHSRTLKNQKAMALAARGPGAKAKSPSERDAALKKGNL